MLSTGFPMTFLVTNGVMLRLLLTCLWLRGLSLGFMGRVEVANRKTRSFDIII